MSLKTGEVLHDCYRTEALLGEEGMGAVYRAGYLLHDTLLRKGIWKVESLCILLTCSCRSKPIVINSR